MTIAAVVGSGPNGLAAAVALARAGLSVRVYEARDTIGGGTRTEQLTVPGVWHDLCSAVHPLAAGSPFFRSIGLDVTWRYADIDLAHPVDASDAAVLTRSVGDTAAGLGVDGPAWERTFAQLVEHFDALAPDLLQPVPHLPRHPALLTRFGARALLPATTSVRTWRTDAARALFAGIAAHSFRPLDTPFASAVALVLGAAGHRYGWPVPAGGARAITDALAADLRRHGGHIETGRRIDDLREMDADVVLLDTTPSAALALAGDRLPPRVAHAYRRYRYGPAAFKLDLAVDGGVPWTDEACHRAGTVHVGGTLEQIAAAEGAVARGVMPERPFVLVAQQYLADPARAAGDIRPVWTYAHVPHGYAGDASEAILTQLERFAPGLRERIVEQVATGPRALQAANANYVGGDISAGANDPWQLLFRPRFALDPYRTGIPGVYLCSAATPPGGGVHGMCGANAARSALRDLAR